MIFNSLTFIFFFAIFMSGWQLVKKNTPVRLLYIVIGSAVFYGWWDWRFLFLIFYVGGVDYLLMRRIDRVPQKMRIVLLVISVCNALGTLFLFKYSAFFAGAVDSLLQTLSIDFRLSSRIPKFCLILPVGISFFTFQSMSYTIDIYRKKLEPARNYIHYMAYLMLFPQLVAGPIVRAGDLLPKLLEPPKTTASTNYAAMKLILLGFFKKCVLADNIAYFVDVYFSNVFYQRNSCESWMVMVLFAIQIYCDFSGYSDIARGIIKLMGYRFALNFNHPYIAGTFRDFWKRWHISLSSWFCDYVYIPLGGSGGYRGTEIRKKLPGIKNMWISFLLSGLWHGAAWNFLIWGGLHALYLTVERLTGYTRFLANTVILRWVGIILVQAQVIIAWVFFRAQTFGEGVHIVKTMFSFQGPFDLDVMKYPLFYLGVFCAMELFLLGNGDHWLHRGTRQYYRLISPVLLAFAAIGIIFFRGSGHDFIYFQF